MAQTTVADNASPTMTRTQLIDLLNEDLAREYQAIIAYVVYSQVLKGAEYMNIAEELEMHAARGTGSTRSRSPSRSTTSAACRRSRRSRSRCRTKAEDMLRFDLDNENETIRNYRERVRQCEALGEYAMAEDIREILRQEQEHQIDLATALGENVPDVSKAKK